MNKDRLGAFMDAVIAIVMTILVLELEKPSAPTLEAFLALKNQLCCICTVVSLACSCVDKPA